MPPVLLSLVVSLIETVFPRMLRVTPVVRSLPGMLYVRTSFLDQMFRLFAFAREAEFSPLSRSVRIAERHFWFVRRERTIPLDRIDYVDTRYEGIQSSFRDREVHAPLRDAVTVSLVLKDPRERVDLAEFASVHWADQTLRQRFAPLIGADAGAGDADPSEAVFHTFLTRLKEETGASLGPRFLENTAGDGSVTYCPACGHVASAVWATCLYCGGQLVRAERQGGADESPAADPPTDDSGTAPDHGAGQR